MASVLTGNSTTSFRTSRVSGFQSTAMAFRAAGRSSTRPRTLLSSRSGRMVPARSGTKRYAAYSLTAGALTMRLSARNLGTEPLPFGLGFHPWIVRSPRTQLYAKAERVILETNDHLPAAKCVSRRGPSGTSPRRARFPPTGSITPSSAGTVEREFFGRNGDLRLMSRPIRRSRLISSIRPQPRPTSSVSSLSRIPLMRIICPAARRPMV